MSLQVIMGAVIEDWATAGVKPATLRIAAADAAKKSFVMVSPPRTARLAQHAAVNAAFPASFPCFGVLGAALLRHVPIRGNARIRCRQAG